MASGKFLAFRIQSTASDLVAQIFFKIGCEKLIRYVKGPNCNTGEIRCEHNLKIWFIQDMHVGSYFICGGLTLFPSRFLTLQQFVAIILRVFSAILSALYTVENASFLKVLVFPMGQPSLVSSRCRNPFEISAVQS